jgi:3-deoxy-D-manno-octulosonic-acid transferase
LSARRLYSLAAYLLSPAYVAALLWRGLKERGYWRGLGERLGLGPTIGPGALWLHAASVGEVQAAAALVRALRRKAIGRPLVITTSTPAGAARARALFGAERDGGVDVRFAPLDLPGAVGRFLNRVRPCIGVVMETEVWPNLFLECRRRRVPLALASARLSERSARRYGLLRGLMAQALCGCEVIAAQSESDAARYLALGAPPACTHVVGNIKFDLEVPAETIERGRALRARFGNRPVWVAGSTHAGEEQAALDAHALVRRAHPNALLVLAPRHPPRCDEVAARLAERGVAFARRSRDETCDAATQVLLLDTLGELLDFDAAADVAFVGGSLVPVGGHNLLEPAALARPVLTGPYYFNAAGIARLLIDQGAAQVVRDARELGERVAELLADPRGRETMGARARAIVEENRGALARLLALIEPLLAR